MNTIRADFLLGASETGQVLSNAVLEWQDGKIKAVSGEPDFKDFEGCATQKIKIIAPGFINGHAHLELYRDQPVEYCDNFGQWLIDVACEFGQASEEKKLARAKQSAELLLKNGCTFINDVSSSGQSAKALSEFGIRGTVNLEYFHPQHHPNEERLNRLEELYYRISDLYKNRDDIFIGVSPHSPYNVSPCGLSEVLNRLKPRWIHTHMAESQSEKDWFDVSSNVVSDSIVTPLPRTFESPTASGIGSAPQGERGQLMDINDIHQKFIGDTFGPQFKGSNGFEHFESILKEYANNSAVTFAHGNYLTSQELQVMATQHWGLFTCPCSNHFLNHPPLDIQTVIEQNVLLGLGTDGLVSNTQLDLRAEARLIIQRGVSAIEVFKMLTINAAKALQLKKLAGLELGQLQAGFAADFVLYEAELNAETQSVGALYEALFSEETHVKAVWVGGKSVL